MLAVRFDAVHLGGPVLVSAPAYAIGRGPPTGRPRGRTGDDPGGLFFVRLLPSAPPAACRGDSEFAGVSTSDAIGATVEP